jgi:hypothetical protein
LSPIQAQTYAEKKGEEEKNNKPISLLVQLFCFHSLPGSVVSSAPPCCLCVCCQFIFRLVEHNQKTNQIWNTFS